MATGPQRINSILLCTAVSKILKPRNHCDRASLRNVCRWSTEKVSSGEWPERLETVLIDFAKEATDQRVRNPMAAFMAMVKKELGYIPPTSQRNRWPAAAREGSSK